MTDFAKELWYYLRLRKKIWILPLLFLLTLLGTLILLARGTMAAPFVYTFF